MNNKAQDALGFTRFGLPVVKVKIEMSYLPSLVFLFFFLLMKVDLCQITINHAQDWRPWSMSVKIIRSTPIPLAISPFMESSFMDVCRPVIVTFLSTEWLLFALGLESTMYAVTIINSRYGLLRRYKSSTPPVVQMGCHQGGLQLATRCRLFDRKRLLDMGVRFSCTA